MGSASKLTASICTSEKFRGKHVFMIDGYSLKKGRGVGDFVRSATFTVGGYDWAIRVYPDGADQDSRDYLSMGLELRSNNAEVWAFFNLWLVKRSRRLGCSTKGPILFKSTEGGWYSALINKFILRSELEMETSMYIKKDGLMISCELTVVKEPHVYQTWGLCEIKVPPSNIKEHFAKLLEAKEGAKKTKPFVIDQELFSMTARKIYRKCLFHMVEHAVNCCHSRDVSMIMNCLHDMLYPL